ncbi:MAG TPA: FMN-binding negative transcriptional regulator [Polyangiaceae bacterium]|nr:FMN-binding negative transcriptional regulator [Polyangiaceae bacterium]
MPSREPALYVPSVFRETETTRLFEIIERYSFATLVTATAEGPLVSHIPFSLDRERGERGTLYGHVARANPHWRYLEPGSGTRVIFTGPHAYVSPSWYVPSPDNVPTWNYAVVHATGQVKLLADGRATLQILKRLVEAHESRSDSAYTVNVDDPVLQGVAKGVVAFELQVTELEGKFKLSQNRPELDRLSVVKQLGANADPAIREVAELMRRLD